MANKVVRYLLLSQFSLFGFLGICGFINPKFLFGEGGVSNYGVHASTVIPFTLAFVLNGIFLILATHNMPKSPKVYLLIRSALRVQAFLIFAVLLSTYPYKLNQTYKYIHITVGALLLLCNYTLICLVSLRLFRNRLNYALLLTETIGFLLTFLTLLGFFHLLFVAQLLTSITFGIFLISLGIRICESNVNTAAVNIKEI